MGEEPRPYGRADRRRAARLALAAGTGAVLVLLVFAGLRSVVLVGAGVAGLALTAAGAWWVLARSGPVRALALVMVVAAPTTVVVLYMSAGLLWVVLVSLALWVLALRTGRAALAEDVEPAGAREVPAAPPRRPFLIMNPRSGGGKVGRFDLVEKAEALGAEVVVLDPDRPQDVAELARRAVADGADLLGVAGGDGTQALVAGVAAEHDVPFLVVSAGTRNHFALDLGLDRDDPSTCLEALADGVEFRVDLGLADGRVFVNNASFGAYAAVVQSPAYRDDKVRTTLRTLPDLLAGESGPHLVVRVGTVTIDGPQALLVSNNPYRTDDPAGLGRRERLDRGVLGVLGVRVENARQAAWLLRGGHAPGLTATTAREVVVEADAPTVPAGIDGEALTLPVPVRCRIAPGALRVRVPRDRPGVPPVKPPMDWRRVRRLALTTVRTAAGREAGRSAPTRGGP
ncbi:diacylglycerol/lipid kinase family protein [Streptomyces sp. NPDC059506]|uniref:diacylglycerol/lipid kinase family protein n=1 Tax=Streptomyces TaxID=1883 RepID=UPI000CC3A6EA|nr:diacylglycerol kinase family protein [Streptomyces sp. SCUT-3]PLW66550.1 diacylglycerol kinase [Streptomyces sp. DJ]QMV20657.1 diacylglycerol kinase [Streptomyces sp. SCUT-3]